MLYHSAIKLEARLLQALAATRVATVENGHVVLLGYGVDGVEKTKEVLLSVDVLLAVCTE